MSRTTQFALLVLVAVSLMWPGSSISSPHASLVVAESGLAAQEPPHGTSSAGDPCTVPDCASHVNCPTGMSMSNCNLSGLSCSIAGVGVQAHQMDERWFQRRSAVSFRGPAKLIFKHRSVSIFHPPRFS